MEKLGIDVLKPLILWAFKVGQKFEGITGDWVQKIPVIVIALLGGLTYLGKLDIAYAQLKDLDIVEKEEIHAAVIEQFDLTNDEVEEKIEMYLGYVLDAWTLIVGAFYLRRK
jgi:hypothetical protein